MSQGLEKGLAPGVDRADLSGALSLSSLTLSLQSRDLGERTH